MTSNHPKIFWTGYFILQGIILIVFKTLDIRQLWTAADHLKYYSILINTIALMFLLISKTQGTGTKGILTSKSLIPLALLLTLAADTFLIYRKDHFLLGVILFCLVETCYALELSLPRNKKAYSWLWLRLGIVLVGSLLLRILQVTDALVYASLYSMVFLTINTLQAFHKKQTLFGIALLLFWGCDLCVGLQNLISTLPLAPSNSLMLFLTQGTGSHILADASFMIWVFYLPSQVLILYYWWKVGNKQP